MIVQNLMEKLRPLVGLNGWDYCVLWTLSDDQRCIELTEYCCCGGAKIIDNYPDVVFPCRDCMFQHSRTSCCDLLAQLPSSIPLDSGIYTQTLLSNQPRWFNFSNTSDSTLLQEIIGSKVLVPAPFGLIELFSTKQVPEDKNIIDFIVTRCAISTDQELGINSGNMEALFSANRVTTTVNDIRQSNSFTTDHDQLNDHPNNHLENFNITPYDLSLDTSRICNSSMDFLQQFQYASENRINNENQTDNNGFQEIDALLMHNSMISSTNEENMNMQQLGTDDRDLVVKHEMINGRSGSISNCSDQIDDDDDEDDAKYRRRTGKDPQSKNLKAERKRRKKLQERLYKLRSLVPKISKLDRASILGDAIEFVKELQKQVKELQDELEEHEHPDDEAGASTTVTVNNGKHINNSSVQSYPLLNQNGVCNNIGPRVPERDKVPKGYQLAGSLAGRESILEPNHDIESSNDKAQQMEPQVKVAQIDGNEFFVKVFCEHKAGGFGRLIEALNSLGLEVTHANVTSFRKLVSNVLKVKKKDSEMLEADDVRESLLELTKNPFTHKIT